MACRCDGGKREKGREEGREGIAGLGKITIRKGEFTATHHKVKKYFRNENQCVRGL